MKCTRDSHEAMKRDERWQSLQLIGYQPTETEDGKPARPELKNCARCESTLAIEVSP